MKPVACWHVASEERLLGNLQNGVCDLYPMLRADRWFDRRMRLNKGDRVQFCCKGRILAKGTIDSRPHTLSQPLDADWPSGVEIVKIEYLINPQDCACYHANPRFGSHRLGGSGPCS